MLKCAIIGTGLIGAIHAEAIGKIDGCELVAMVDLNEAVGQKAADEHGCHFYTDAEEMLRQEAVDIVHICLPTFLHEKYVLLAAWHKKHVLCEKPFALSVESARRMACECEKAGVKLMVAQAVRWWPEFLEIKKLYDKGVFGKLHMISSSRLAQHPNWSTWHRDPMKSGGSLFDLNLHNIDFLYSLLGPVKSVYAVGWKSPSGCWNHVCASLTFRNGAKAMDEGTLEITDDYPFTVSFRITGEKATADYRFTAGFNIRQLNTAAAQTLLFTKGGKPQELQISGTDAYEAEITDFAACVEKDLPVPIPPSESIEVIKIISDIEKSLETGKVIEVK